jgi:hypothetical protein
MLEQLVHNFRHNFFKPLLLFFYMGFAIPLLKVPFEFPQVLYQGLTIYLLIAIGWHGGEELASLSAVDLQHASGFMIVGFLMNILIGMIAFFIYVRPRCGELTRQPWPAITARTRREPS